MSEDEIFEMIKTSFEKQEKENIVEYLSALLSKLLSNGVSIECEAEPSYIEYTDNDGALKRIYASYNKSSIRDTLTINFSEHDKNVKDELRKEIFKNHPRLNGAKS